MDKKIIGNKLRQGRKNKNMSVKEVAKAFEQHHPISEKTIYGWENGNTQPDADTFLFLCGLYEFDNVMETFDYRIEEEPIVFTATEKELIKSYRKHPELQIAVQKLLEVYSNPIE